MLVFLRDETGGLTSAGSFATGGTGTGAQGGLPSQGAVILIRDGRWLFVSNPGSGDISVLAVSSDGLTLTDKVGSGGQMPLSVALRHNLLYVLNAGGLVGDSDNITGTTYTDTGLVNGTTYGYVIVAWNEFGSSPASDELTATPQVPSATEPPTALTAAGAKRKINLAWVQSTTPGVTENKIYRSDDGNTFAFLIAIPAATAYSDQVPAGSKYYYVVTAVSPSGESAASNSAFATAK